jgi:hypothetical protein
MTSSQNVTKAGSTPGTGSRSNAPPGGPKAVRHFPEDPRSDGILMAVFDGAKLLYRRDAYFQAKLTSVDRILYEGEDVHMIRFELNFMRSFSQQYRFRGADIDITVQKVFDIKPSDSKPSIRKIFPTVLTVDVSEREIQKNNEVSAGAGATAGSAQLNLSVKETHQDKTSFKGTRKFHGIIKGDSAASWRLYEEKGSQSGIPSIFRIATLVHCPKGEFQIKLKMSARMVKWPKLFGLYNLYFDSSFSANTSMPTNPLTVPQLSIPIDWRKLYGKAEQIFLDDGGSTAPNNEGSISPNDEESIPSTDSSTDGSISGFKERCETAKGLDDEEKEILANFCKGFREVREAERATHGQEKVLAKLKVYLAGQDESNKAVKELAESMGISSPDKQEVPSREPAPEDSSVILLGNSPSDNLAGRPASLESPYLDNLRALTGRSYKKGDAQ